MDRKSIWVLAAILVLAAGCAPKANAPADVAAIKAMVAAYGQAATTGDVTALSDQYTDDAVRLEPNAPIRVGKEAIQSAWRTFLDVYSTEEVDVAEDVCVLSSIIPQNNRPKIPTSSWGNILIFSAA